MERKTVTDTIQDRYEIIDRKLEKHSQQQLLMFWGELNETEKASLLAEIEKLNFEQIAEWVEKYVKAEAALEMPAEIAPAPAYPAEPKDEKQKQKYDLARKLGEELIAAGKVAAFVVAGGQGTRLGYDGPKGNYPISPIKNKTLFEIFAETIIAVGKKHDVKLPWYVMTSPLNHEQTIEIFKTNGYYGMAKEDVCIFQQGTLANFSFDGKILLAEKGKIASSPDGHGGSLKALHTSGAIEDMKARGVEFISYFQVDNPLINIFDSLFIGLHAMDDADMSSIGLTKAGAMEKVGNFCLVDGRITVIEYSDLPGELAQKRKADGSLLFEFGSIAIHIISTDFVAQLNAEGFALPIHRAVKKIPYIDDNGVSVTSTEPNGIKLETFVFDALPLAEKSIILETLRSEEFAPVKNASGADSAEVTKRMMTQRAAAWLEAAGVIVPKTDDSSIDCTIEIAPSFAVCKEDVLAKKDRLPNIASGNKIYLE